MNLGKIRDRASARKAKEVKTRYARVAITNISRCLRESGPRNTRMARWKSMKGTTNLLATKLQVSASKGSRTARSVAKATKPNIGNVRPAMNGSLSRNANDRNVTRKTRRTIAIRSA